MWWEVCCVFLVLLHGLFRCFGSNFVLTLKRWFLDFTSAVRLKCDWWSKHCPWSVIHTESFKQKFSEMEANTPLQITLSGTALDCSELLVGRLYCLTSTKLKMNYSKMLVSATLKQKTNFKLKYSVKINWLMQKVALFKLTKKVC